MILNYSYSLDGWYWTNRGRRSQRFRSSGEAQAALLSGRIVWSGGNAQAQVRNYRRITDLDPIHGYTVSRKGD